MIKQHQGFIFLMTLSITAVISLLVLTSMQHILLYHKAINKQEELHQDFYQLEAVAVKLARKETLRSGCISHHDAANQALYQLIHLKGCFLKRGKTEYQYFIEDLGSFPCLVVRQNGVKHATYHRRVSVVQMEEGRPGALLQIRFITVGAVLNCYAKEQMIRLGVSSWRYMSLV